MLLDYDRVFAAMGIPACLWRRTGEIFKGNREFAELVGVSEYMLRDVSDGGFGPLKRFFINTTVPWRLSWRLIGTVVYL